MLVHPYQDPLPVHEGTRLLDATLDVVGLAVLDPRVPTRAWAVQTFFAPITRRMIGGVRARLVDAYGFVSFINQRDLEVLLGLGVAGQLCPWTGGRYIGVGERDWCGLFVDDDDLLDDLQLRELELRMQSIELGLGPVLQEGMTLTRLVHVDEGLDLEEAFQLVWDDGYSDMERLQSRWSRLLRRRVAWR